MGGVPCGCQLYKDLGKSIVGGGRMEFTERRPRHLEQREMSRADHAEK